MKKNVHVFNRLKLTQQTKFQNLNLWNFGEIDEKSPKLNSGLSMRKNENFWKFENFSESAFNSECTEIKFSSFRCMSQKLSNMFYFWNISNFWWLNQGLVFFCEFLLFFTIFYNIFRFSTNVYLLNLLIVFEINIFLLILISTNQQINI